MPEKPDLKPCPFCGAETASFVCHDPDSGFPHLDVVCNSCGARVETDADWGDKGAAASEWNRRTLAGNMIQMRGWMKLILNMAEHNDQDFGNPAIRGLLDQLTRIHTAARAALSAPARNCDRFATADKARAAFEAEHSRGIVLNLYTATFDWLFAQAEGGDHA